MTEKLERIGVGERIGGLRKRAPYNMKMVELGGHYWCVADYDSPNYENWPELEVCDDD